jgi:hypothetical protein
VGCRSFAGKYFKRMTKYFFLPVFFFSLAFQPLFSQKNEFKVACVGFYNFENLFDTIDSPDTNDSEFRMAPAVGTRKLTRIN